MSETIFGGSYQPAELSGGLEEELARLKEQVELSWTQEQRLLGQIGIRNGQRILEVGSGPGLFTERLCAWLPESLIECVEADPLLADLARARYGTTPNVEIRVADLNTIEPGMQGYDWVIARYVFQHLRDSVASASHLLDLLRPGGGIAVIDVDDGLWGIAEPFVPEVQNVYIKASMLQAQRSGNRLIGRRLWRVLKASGYVEVDLESFVYHSDSLGLHAFNHQLSPQRLRPALEAGLITVEEFGLVEKVHQRFMASEDAYVLMIGLLAHGKRPFL